VTLASLDIKDAFLQVPQDKIIGVELYGTEYLVLRNLPGQRLGAKAWYWYFRNYVTEVLNCSWCKGQPCIGKCVVDGVHNTFMFRVDDLLFAGSHEFWVNKLLPAMTSKFSVSYNELKGVDSSICFLKRKLVKLKDGLMVVPGTTAEKVVACFEQAFGQARAQKIPCDSSIQNPDTSQQLTAADGRSYRSVIGLLLYLARERMDVMFAVKELATYMSAPTLCALQRLRKVIGYLKTSGDMGVKLVVPESGLGKWKSGGEPFWLVETFTDADWSANKQHRKSTSSAIHFVNGSFVYASSRSQRVVSLSSAESELLEFLTVLTGKEVDHYQWTDNSAARQLVPKQGVGRIRHLSGKLLWVQDMVLSKQLAVGQIPTEWNYSDIGTKPLNKSRLMILLNQIGAMDPINLEMIGQEEFDAVSSRLVGQQGLKRVAKALFRMAALWGLESLAQNGAEAAEITFEDGGTCMAADQPVSNSSETWWLWFVLALMFLLWTAFAVAGYMAWRKLSHDLFHCWNQLGDEDSYIAQQAQRIDMLDGKYYELGERITENNNELSMTHDYVSGVHYAVVEGGGFLRNGLGLTHDQWIHLNMPERANMQAHHTMCTAAYMHLVRQRVGAVGRADSTDDPGAQEGGESENPEEDAEVENPSEGIRYGPSIAEMYEALKQEQRLCLIEGDLRDSAIIQNLMLMILQVSQSGLTAETAAPLRQKVVDSFRRMEEVARFQQRWEAADRYQAVTGIYDR
jgi:hypothetical protein